MSRESANDCLCFACVPESNYAIVQNFGKHSRIIGSGFNCLVCPMEAIPVGGVMSLRVRQLDVDVTTKTKDNVTISVLVAIQFCVHKGEMPNRADKNNRSIELDGTTENQPGTPLFDAFYSLSDVNAQVNNYVENVIRGAIPRMDLDEVFSEKDKLNLSIKQQLNERMKTFGYDIRDALITNLTPDGRVAVNEINASTTR